MTTQMTTITTVNTSPTNTAKVSLSNRFADKDFNITWFPNINYVDFSFTVEVPSKSLTSFWAAFAFSKDTEMVNNIQLNSITCYAYLDTRSVPINTVSHTWYKMCCFLFPKIHISYTGFSGLTSKIFVIYFFCMTSRFMKIKIKKFLIKLNNLY
jgi:hypothetical protein